MMVRVKLEMYIANIKIKMDFCIFIMLSLILSDFIQLIDLPSSLSLSFHQQSILSPQHILFTDILQDHPLASLQIIVTFHTIINYDLLLQSIIINHLLTMNQPFKIRKNKSQKDIKFSHDHHKFNSHHQILLQNCNHQIDSKSLPKNAQLEPLKNKLNIIQNFMKRGERGLDFTQPVNLKKNCGNKLDSRYEYNMIGQDVTIPFKPMTKDKQNRPCSMNDLKYNNTFKVKPNFYNTEKYESLKLFPSILKNRLQNDVRLQKIDEQGGKQNDGKSHKNKSQKYLSQAMGKINKRQNKQISKTKTQSQQQQTKQQYSFRKSLLHQLLQKNKANCLEKQINTIKPYFQQKFGQLSIIQSNISQLEENHETPIQTKQFSIFQVDCSTIRDNKGNQQSFISNKAIHDFIKPAQQLNLPSIQEKTHVEKKKRLEIDKIRKKFPQNFFK